MGIDIIHYRMRTTHGAHRCPQAGKIMTVGQLKKNHNVHNIAKYIGVTLGGGVWVGDAKTNKLGKSGEKGCTYVKGWFKAIFPLFLTWLLRQL